MEKLQGINKAIESIETCIICLDLQSKRSKYADSINKKTEEIGKCIGPANIFAWQNNLLTMNNVQAIDVSQKNKLSAILEHESNNNQCFGSLRKKARYKYVEKFTYKDQKHNMHKIKTEKSNDIAKKTISTYVLSITSAYILHKILKADSRFYVYAKLKTIKY